ncbi:hypothetical protein AJ79_01215 [Helicocarpus griseus UAMH5409]|uniref:Vacuolar import and degradation protein-domain-containing protein n=1 Tax=Helicocarpus griseus UAMH5409 TaxID=1447875 RepID=A0A2B7Y8E9_9EURO|nr:hypothetical protein AJ79_01215 [Helicocarpus griseus UAMH5409]
MSFRLPEDEVNEDNISFLRSRRRSSLDSSPGRVRSRRRQQLQHLEDELINSMDSNDHSRPPVSVGVSRRIPIVRRQRDALNSPSNYETRSRPPNSIYAWAIGSDQEDDEDSSVDPANHLLQDMWDGRLLRARHAALGSRGDRREGPAAFAHLSTGDSDGESSSQPSRYGRSDLATATLLNSVRRHPRFSSRSRTLQTYILDRERSGNDSEERDWQPAIITPTMHINRPTSPPHRSPAASRGDLPRSIGLQELRDMYSEDSPKPDRLEETIKYLDRVRYSTSYEESLQVAIAADLVPYGYLRRNEDDFILDTSTIGCPEDSSWLRPGTVFQGSQHATNQCPSSAMFPQRRQRSQQDIDPVIINGSEIGRINVYTSTGRRYHADDGSHEFGNGGPTGTNSNNGIGGSSSRHEHWPVKVTIHDVDYSTMTLSGTMEAYNIPDKTNNNQGAHIITFLEGEIIDFHTHSLETNNFKANAEVDSLYWRELEPFKNMSYDEIVKNLVSKKWVTEYLAKGWILMRWKERCFVSPSHSRQGLTISGFYYISVRREDGHIEGMYYDPGSSPYQHLSLDPEMKNRMVFPSYSFR